MACNLRCNSIFRTQFNRSLVGLIRTTFWYKATVLQSQLNFDCPLIVTDCFFPCLHRCISCLEMSNMLSNINLQHLYGINLTLYSLPPLKKYRFTSWYLWKITNDRMSQVSSRWCNGKSTGQCHRSKQVRTSGWSPPIFQQWLNNIIASLLHGWLWH